MIRNIAVSSLCAILVVLAVLGWKDAHQKHTQPFAQFCSNASDGQLTCRVSLVALAFDPSALGDRRISSRGLLVIDHGSLAIYPSEEAFRSGDRRLALRVKAPEEVQRQLVRDFQGKIIGFRGRLDSDEVISLRNGFMAAVVGIEHVGPAILPEASTPGSEDSLTIDVDDLDRLE